MSIDGLIAVYPDGRYAEVANTYESIKEALNGATLDLVGLPDGSGLFVDDNGMIEGLTLNVPASIFASMCLFGPVVLCGPPDEEGETQPPDERVVVGFLSLTTMWRSVCQDALRKNQRILVAADPDTIPPAQIIPLTEDQFEAYLKGEWQP
jgi:hypothetical protein